VGFGTLDYAGSTSILSAHDWTGIKNAIISLGVPRVLDRYSITSNVNLLPSIATRPHSLRMHSYRHSDHL
jgi:hypothetical protein